MATWGSYLKSYVVKEVTAPVPLEGEKPAEKIPEKITEKIPIQPIVPLLDYGSAQRTIQPIFLEEGDDNGNPTLTAAPNAPGQANAGRLAKLFGYGAGVEPKFGATVDEPTLPQMPKMSLIVQQAQDAEQARKLVESSQPAANAVPQLDQPSASRVAKLFGYAAPAKVDPEQKPDLKLEDLKPKEVLNKIPEPEKPEANPVAQPGPSKIAKLFGYGTPVDTKPDQTLEKEIENKVLDSEKPNATSHERSQSNSSRVAKMFGYPEPTAAPEPAEPKPSVENKQKPASDPWAALEQAELEWTAITLEKPVLKVAVPENQKNISELVSARSSATYSSHGRYSSVSSTTSSSRSISSAISEVSIPDYVLKAEEAERKRKVLEVEQRAEKMVMEQQQMEMELLRMRIEEEDIRKEAERIAQEEFEMNEYIREVGVSKAAVLYKAIQNPDPGGKAQVSPSRDYTPQSTKRPNPVEIPNPIEKLQEQDIKIEMPLGRMTSQAKERLDRVNAEVQAERLQEETKRSKPIKILSRIEKPQEPDVKVEVTLGRTKSRAKERLDRVNAEAEAERLKEEEKRQANAEENASDYASVYDDYASVYDDASTYESEGEDEAKLYRDEAEKVLRLEEQRVEEEERLEREKAELWRKESERWREAKEVARRIEEERIAEQERLKMAEEERLQIADERRLKAAEEERIRLEKQEALRLQEEARLRLEKEEAQRIEDERKQAERRKQEKLDRMKKEEEQQQQAEREEREARKEAERIKNERSAQQQREAREREIAGASEEGQWFEKQKRAREERQEAQRLKMQRQTVEDDEEEPAETKEEQIRKAEERIYKAFAGLAAERGGAPTPTPIPAIAAPSALPANPRGPANPYRTDIRGGRAVGPKPLPATPGSNRSGGGANVNRSATMREKEDSGRGGDGGNLPVRAATTAGTRDRDGAVESGEVRPRPVIRGGLPGGPKVGLPSGGPRGGGGLPMNPRARRT